MKTKEAVATALVSMLLLAPVGCGSRQKEAEGETLAMRETEVFESYLDAQERRGTVSGHMRSEAADEVSETGSLPETEAALETDEVRTAEKGRGNQARKREAAEVKKSPEVPEIGEEAAGSAKPVEKEAPTLDSSSQESTPALAPPAETKAPVLESSAETPVTEPPVPAEPPVTEPVETEPPKPKSIYDQDFDIGAIRQELISIGEGLGLTHVTEDDGIPCTPDTCSWASPVTASASFQGEQLKQALHGYVTSMPSMVASYGGPQISCFTIYVRNNGGGSYTFYFLY